MDLEGEQIIVLTEGVKAKVIPTLGYDASCLSYIVGDNIFTGDSYIPCISTQSSDKTAVLESEKMIQQLAIGRFLCLGHGPLFK